MSLLPEPVDLEKDECSSTFQGLKDEIDKLHEKYGQQATDCLREVSMLVQKYESLLGDYNTKVEKQVLEKYRNIDQSTVSKAQNIVRAFLKRRRFTALASHFLSSPLAKELGKRNDIWKEILTTERAYFQRLVILYETYYKPLKMRIVNGQDHKVLTDKQISKIFQNIDDIKNTAKTMWKRLEEACKNWPEQTPKVGAIFLAMIPEIKGFYIPYCKQIGEALKNLAKMRKKSHTFAEFLDKTANDALASNGDSLPLSSSLMMPITRLGQYETYLRDLLVLTPGEHVDHPTLAKAAREIANIAHECVPTKTDATKLQRLFNVTQTLRGASAPNLLTKDVRAFVREGPVLTVTDKKVKRAYLFLFTDSLIVTDVNEGTEDRTFDTMITLVGSEVRDVSDSQQAAHMFAITRENKRTVFSCSTYEEKKSWMNDVLALISSNGAPAASATAKRTGSQLFSRGGSNADIRSHDSSLPISPSRGLDRHASATSDSTHSGTSSSATSVLSPRTKKSKLAGMIQSAGFLHALDRQHSTKALEDFVDVIPAKVKLVKLSHKEVILKFSGPLEGETDSEKSSPFSAAKSISTMPYLKKKNHREGDPIADHFGIAAFHNRILAAIADGGSTGGLKSQQASSRAVETAITDFTETKGYLSDLRDVAIELIKSLAHVHELIVQGKKVVWDAGTSTLLAGLLVEVEPNPQVNNANWTFVCANVGNCKAFLWSKSNSQVSEITLGSKGTISDSADPGGRLGPYIYQGAPDLRNLQLFFAPCAVDDLVILLTNGVYDNMDPELNGLTPKDLQPLMTNYPNRIPLRPDQLTNKWDQLDPSKTETLKTSYRNIMIEKLVNEVEGQPTPRAVSKALVAQATKITRSLREYAEANVDKPNPQDHQLYPGKMDHATCLVFQVGQVQM